MKFVLSVVALLICLCGVYSYPDGAPESACSNLVPKESDHGPPQTSTVPYYIFVDPLCRNGSLTYTPGQTYTRKFSTPTLLVFASFWENVPCSASNDFYLFSPWAQWAG